MKKKKIKSITTSAKIYACGKYVYDLLTNVAMLKFGAKTSVHRAGTDTPTFGMTKQTTTGRYATILFYH